MKASSLGIKSQEQEQNEVTLLNEAERERVRTLQRLITERELPGHGKRQEEAAKKLGITVRSVRRLVSQLKEKGSTCVVRQTRSDRGKIQIDKEWEEFIVKTYRQGNRGSTQMSPAQVFVRVEVRAREIGTEEYPSRMTVYRILNGLTEQGQKLKRSLGYKEDHLLIKTKEGTTLEITHSNQVWQCDHTKVDVLLVDQAGESLGRPWLTTVVDTYSRCIMGINLGFESPSALVVCLALRHAILPKQYSADYEMQENWGSYGIPMYLYTDAGKDFRSKHIEHVGSELGITQCLRRKPSDGGIVERPFGTLNSQFFSSLPGYVSSSVATRSPKAESEACLTLWQMEKLLVRYIVDNYNQSLDARMANQSRIARWDAGKMPEIKLLGERELDVCLMRRERRRVYRSGYIHFATLTYKGEYLAGYAGASVIIRYDPRDITMIFVYQIKKSKEVFLARAYAQGWEAERLSYREAQVISQRRREAGKAVDNRSKLEEVRDRDGAVRNMKKEQKKNRNTRGGAGFSIYGSVMTSMEDLQKNSSMMSIDPLALKEIELMEEEDAEFEDMRSVESLPYVRVYDYEELRREAGLI
jgi:putative transposase